MTRRWMISALILVLAVGVGAAAQTPAGKTQPTPTTGKSPAALATPKDRRSYALGIDLGNQLRNNLVEVDADVFARGLKDGLAGGAPLLTPEEVRAAIADLQADMKRRISESRKMGAEDNKKIGDAFRAENQSKEGVVTLASGLQYKVLQAGNGPKPTLDDTVVCHYRGTLVNGEQFDSSYDRGQPLAFPLKNVIKGWTEALRLMPVGSKWQLVVPPELAYGENGAGNQIGPGATLVFEVELISIKGRGKH